MPIPNNITFLCTILVVSFFCVHLRLPVSTQKTTCHSPVWIVRGKRSSFFTSLHTLQRRFLRVIPGFGFEKSPMTSVSVGFGSLIVLRSDGLPFVHKSYLVYQTSDPYLVPRFKGLWSVPDYNIYSRRFLLSEFGRLQLKKHIYYVPYLPVLNK